MARSAYRKGATLGPLPKMTVTIRDPLQAGNQRGQRRGLIAQAVEQAVRGPGHADRVREHVEHREDDECRSCEPPGPWEPPSSASTVLTSRWLERSTPNA